MSKFKIGDKVKIVSRNGLVGFCFAVGDIGVVTGYSTSSGRPDVKVYDMCQYVDDCDLELISTFSIGDRVKLIKPLSPVQLGEVGTVIRIDGMTYPLRVDFSIHGQAWICEDEIEHVKEEEMPPTKLYKALRVKPNGTLASLLIGNTTSIPFAPFKELTYKEGEITYAPEGSRGVFCDNTLGLAEQRARVESNHGRKFEAVVHEVTVLGTTSSRIADITCCPAVLVGRKVYGIAYHPPEPPKEEWKDVTALCHVDNKLSAACARVYAPGDGLIIAHLSSIIHPTPSGFDGFDYRFSWIDDSCFKVERKKRG